MSLETAIERISNISNLTEMKRAKAEFENALIDENMYASMRAAFNQAIAILKEETE